MHKPIKLVNHCSQTAVEHFHDTVCFKTIDSSGDSFTNQKFQVTINQIQVTNLSLWKRQLRHQKEISVQKSKFCCSIYRKVCYGEFLHQWEKRSLHINKQMYRQVVVRQYQRAPTWTTHLVTEKNQELYECTFQRQLFDTDHKTFSKVVIRLHARLKKICP